MRTRNAFTLAEMIAVIGIMLILMVATFGIFNMLGQKMGPDAALATVRAALNGARDYAATNGVLARVHFTVNATKMGDGTTMKLQWWPANIASPQDDQWNDVPNRPAYTFQNQVFVCNGMPDLGSVSAPAVGGITDARKMKQDDVTQWKIYEQAVQKKVTDFAMAGTTLKTTHTSFSACFDPNGYMTRDTTIPVTNGLTIVQLGGSRVITFALFPLNPNTGTQLVFE